MARCRLVRSCSRRSRLDLCVESCVLGILTDAPPIVRTKPDSGIPCDVLLLRGTCIVNEAMLSGESTPLLKESVELREGDDRLDMNGTDRNSVLFSGTKALQVEKAGDGGMTSEFRQHFPPTGF